MGKIVKVRRSILAPALSEDQMLNKYHGKLDAYNGVDHANGPAADAPMVEPELRAQYGNPSFRAQFDISVTKQYFSETAGVYAPIAPAALDANLQVPLPYFIFGLSDFDGGFKRLIGELPINTADWVQGNPFIFGAMASTIEIPIDANVNAFLNRGDLVIPFTSALPGGGVTTLAIIIIRSSQVSYGTLLKSLSSDTFAINLLRYVVQDSTATNLAQFNNDVILFEQSLFGKLTSDSLSPIAFKVPEQQQNDVIDVPINQPMNKARALGGFINFDVLGFNWSLFVSYFNKFGQGKNFPQS